ncbi:hypothetical protein D3C76_996990 [compost metagenome]
MLGQAPVQGAGRHTQGGRHRVGTGEAPGSAQARKAHRFDQVCLIRQAGKQLLAKPRRHRRGNGVGIRAGLLQNRGAEAPLHHLAVELHRAAKDLFITSPVGRWWIGQQQPNRRKGFFQHALDQRLDRGKPELRGQGHQFPESKKTLTDEDAFVPFPAKGFLEHRPQQAYVLDPEIDGLAKGFTAQHGVAEDPEITDALPPSGAQATVGMQHQAPHVGKNHHFLPVRDPCVGVLHLCQRKLGTVQQPRLTHALGLQFGHQGRQAEHVVLRNIL